MEEQFRAVLAAGVAAFMPIARVEWDDITQGAPLPNIRMFVASGSDGAHMQGPNDLFEGRVQVDCYAATRAEARAIGRAALAALHFHRGGGFQGVFHAGTRTGRESGTNEAERPYLVSLDFTLAWRQTDG